MHTRHWLGNERTAHLTYYKHYNIVSIHRVYTKLTICGVTYSSTAVTPLRNISCALVGCSQWAKHSSSRWVKHLSEREREREKFEWMRCWESFVYKQSYPVGNLQHLQAHAELYDTSPPRVDEEWLQAKPYTEVPGPSPLRLISYFLPGGKLYLSYHPKSSTNLTLT